MGKTKYVKQKPDHREYNKAQVWTLKKIKNMFKRERIQIIRINRKKKKWFITPDSTDLKKI